MTSIWQVIFTFIISKLEFKEGPFRLSFEIHPLKETIYEKLNITLMCYNEILNFFGEIPNLEKEETEKACFTVFYKIEL